MTGWVNDWHLSMLVVIGYLLVSIVLYSLSLLYSRKAVDYREVEEQDQ